jgi:hypothetical protein
MFRKFYSLTLMLIAGIVTSGEVFADARSDAASRIKQRLAQVDDMKENGEVGENAMGYLSERKPLAKAFRGVVSKALTQRFPGGRVMVSGPPLPATR